MLIPEFTKYIDRIKQEGISGTDKYGRRKIEDVMTDLVINTSYRRNKIFSIVRGIADGYYNGLPESLINDDLKKIYKIATSEKAKERFAKAQKTNTVTLYESEMKTIAELEDDKLQRLLLASLVYHKYIALGDDGTYYSDVKINEADIYRFARFDSVSGTVKNKLWKKLSDDGLIDVNVRTSNMWQYNHRKESSKALFRVTFDVDMLNDKSSENVYKTITNYDDISLYLRFWMGDDDVIECVDCGCPIVKTSNASKLCSNCRADRKNKCNKKSA